MTAAQHKYTNFYRSFEDRFRGTRESVMSRLAVYLPFVEPLKTLDESPEALDLGCGRGEWLELLQQNGFQAKGVDLDEGMLLACRELNLDVTQADALDYIRDLAAESLSIVSAFHVVEHISFETLGQLVDEAYRVLKPGGLLILETPNSENLVVGTSSFYMDPTHQRPLPAQLLAFVAEYTGFERVKTLYLQESPELAAAQQMTLTNILNGVSPDYAMVAQKKAAKDIWALFNEPFERSYGLRLNALAERYDQQIGGHAQWLEKEWDKSRQRIEEFSRSTGRLEAHSQWLQREWDTAREQNARLEAHAQWLQKEWDTAREQNNRLEAHSQWLQREWDAVREQNTQLETHAQWLQRELDTANAKVHELNQLSHHWWTVADGLSQECKNLYSSRSWRITKPLRLLSVVVKKIINGILVIPKGLWLVFKFPFKLVLAGLIRFILNRPKLKAKVVAKLRRYPRLKAHLHSFASSRGIVSEVSVLTPDVDQETSIAHADSDIPLSRLTPRARCVYQDLKVAIEQQQKEIS